MVPVFSVTLILKDSLKLQLVFHCNPKPIQLCHSPGLKLEQAEEVDEGGDFGQRPIGEEILVFEVSLRV